MREKLAVSNWQLVEKNNCHPQRKALGIHSRNIKINGSKAFHTEDNKKLFNSQLSTLTTNSAFTLVEISVVMLIIGIITASVVAGKRIIDNNNNLRIISEIVDYETDIQKFKNRYFQLPGDFSRAEDIWGAPDTNNGDGDGAIVWNDDEGVQAWQHLQLEGIISTNLTGTATADLAVLGTNVPRSDAIDGAGYFLDFSNTMYNHIGIGTANSTLNNGAILTPRIAAYIDRKLDDEDATTGKVQSSNTDTIANCHSSGTYAFSTAAIGCYLMYRLEID